MWLLFVPAGTGPVYFESGSEQSIENDWVLSLLLWKWIVYNMYYKIVFLIEMRYAIHISISWQRNESKQTWTFT
jgi:hypothetical protein